MKPKLCIVGNPPIIALAREAADQYQAEADFLYIESSLEAAVPLCQGVEGVADFVLAGPSTGRICSEKLTTPVVLFRATLPDLISAIQEAKRLDSRIALCLSRTDKEFDLCLLSDVMQVILKPHFCDSLSEYENACSVISREGFRILIGGWIPLKLAEKVGIRGILLYKGMNSIRSAIQNALELFEIQKENMCRISQLNAIVNSFNDGLVLTDERGQIILDNPPAREKLGWMWLRGKNIADLLHSKHPMEVLGTGERILNVLEKGGIVVNYLPVDSQNRTHGLLCTVKRVNEIEDAEFTVRNRLHTSGFCVKYSLRDVVGQSPAIQACKKKARQYALASDPILITGESGTGKELFAHAVHAMSDRGDGPFVALNCAALVSDLLESELFGYEQGAFTGARSAGKKGLIELSHKGTLFLDEITTLTYPLQAKLLRLLSEKEILKLGSDRIIPVDVRILAATNEDMEDCVREKRFREDLFYRLNVFRLHIPPLSERSEDIVPLFLHFLSRINPRIEKELRAQSEGIRHILYSQPLRGNAREIENIAKRFCLLYTGETQRHLIGPLLNSCIDPQKYDHSHHGKSGLLRREVENIERKALSDLLAQCKTRSEMSKLMGISPSTLWRRLRKYGLLPRAGEETLSRK